MEPAPQQPQWRDEDAVDSVRGELVERPALVDPRDVRALKAQLAEVSSGEAYVVQAGDCAEDPEENTRAHIVRKTALVDRLAAEMAMGMGKPVLRVGRIAGQYGKPRSSPTERVGGVDLPVFRGHMVNSPHPDSDSRRPEPRRLLSGYEAASTAMEHLGWNGGPQRLSIGPTVWTSHEALLLDYEVPMLRGDGTGRTLLSSTHWPWIGTRTGRADGAHVALLTEVENPVAVKVGPDREIEEMLAVCRRLDPEREPGRLTLVARMGADLVLDRLPRLVAAVRAQGHPVIWMCDPMHGNTVTASSGIKTRYVRTIINEVTGFQQAVRESGGVAGGLHLETTPDDVSECALDASSDDRVGEPYTSLCDPRLNPRQALSVLDAWRG
ncbi:phospho-2-dehydro-3-deoxyheptonate aldolase [Halostreptopolyspora alba]|uniref:Phospho-2-dehydro-3-deoxyheptonate aldolase n=2 Tax=Halostreptopolyspora alba TaxID=2487137 RepID=A0A3N0EG44_9ACTN|nr:phospho-2-dehydro-3-deoxyheptonate aldolase [Nocardiopsaceae bacterium YIM 96095]